MNEALILAAGVQERFNHPMPKGLCPLKRSTECLISRMCRQLRATGHDHISIVAASWWGDQYRSKVKDWVDKVLFIDSPNVGTSIYRGLDMCVTDFPLIVSADTYAPESGFLSLSQPATVYDPKRNITLWDYPKTLYKHHAIRNYDSRVDYMIALGSPVMLANLEGWYNIDTQSEWRELNDYIVGKARGGNRPA